MIFYKYQSMERILLVTILLLLVIVPFFSTSPAIAANITALIQSLEDPDINVRIEAAEALGRIKEKQAVIPLIALLRNENLPVSQSAAKALGVTDGTLSSITFTTRLQLA